jgi:glucosamine--fructose-6-phosphate aminotransferase (isomerizing)
MSDHGSGMKADIAEQPAMYERLLDERERVAEIAREIARRRPRHVLLTARGTSDHAALYGSYLTEIRLNIPAGLVSPSTMTVYQARPDLRHCLVIAVSQSGGSPDLTNVVQVAREQGATTLAVTNTVDSPLAQAAELSLDIAAGPERAVAATKTYTAQLLTLALLIEGIRTGDGSLSAEEEQALRALPSLAATVLADDTATELADRYRFANQLVTTGRGYAYPTAREAALKLMETCYLAALSFSGADLLHGPVAMTDTDVPVLAIVGSGPAGASMRDVLATVAQRRADLVVVGPNKVSGALHVPSPDVNERHAPLLDILPLQRLALALSLARGENPDSPRDLRKVTATL